MDIELFSGNTKAIVSTEGGYLTNLSDDMGDLLFPKRTLKNPEGQEKVRGGSHVCLPNFGPGGDSGQEQHGFARTSEWEIKSQSETSLELFLAGKGSYMGMESYLRYQLHDGGLELQLEVKNVGTSPVIVAPAFHPYFMVYGAVEFDGEVIDSSEYSEATFVNGNKHIIRSNDRLITLMSENLPTWALWTDMLGRYICVEPTHSGFSFAEDIKRADAIKPGVVRRYGLRIDWSNSLSAD